jgi:hypothetical protein
VDEVLVDRGELRGEHLVEQVDNFVVALHVDSLPSEHKDATNASQRTKFEVERRYQMVRFNLAKRALPSRREHRDEARSDDRSAADNRRRFHPLRMLRESRSRFARLHRRTGESSGRSRRGSGK